MGPVEENESENRVASWSLAVVHIRIPRWFGGSRTRACESTCFVRSPCTQHAKKGTKQDNAISSASSKEMGQNSMCMREVGSANGERRGG